MGVAPAKIIFMVILSAEVALVSSPNIIIVTLKSKKKCKENFVILQSIGIIAIKEGQSSIPADILVDIYNSANGLN